MTTDAPLVLPSDEAHLWLAQPARATAAALDACRRLLSADERDRADAFAFARHRTEFTVAHALVRRTLSRYLAIPPGELRFTIGTYGRPRLATSVGGIDFNLSHSDGLVACLIGRGVLGVDVENAERPPPLEVAEQVFTAAERAILAAAPAATQARRFFQLWTLKEAYIKARGLGLQLPLEHISFTPRDDGTTVAFTPPIDDDPRRWRFFTMDLPPSHLAAIALCDAPSLRIVTRALDPDLG